MKLKILVEAFDDNKSYSNDSYVSILDDNRIILTYISLKAEIAVNKGSFGSKFDTVSGKYRSNEDKTDEVIIDEFDFEPSRDEIIEYFTYILDVSDYGSYDNFENEILNNLDEYVESNEEDMLDYFYEDAATAATEFVNTGDYFNV